LFTSRRAASPLTAGYKRIATVLKTGLALVRKDGYDFLHEDKTEIAASS
jgi:hypothetical protein